MNYPFRLPQPSNFSTKKHLLLLGSILLYLSAFSQKTATPILDCGANTARQQAAKRNPNYLQKEATFDQRIYEFIQKKKQGSAAENGNPPPYVLPIVVHIIHDGGAENISDGQVLQAVDNLNAAFSASGYYGTKGATADMQIQFCLAKRDPNGNATTGITRDQSPLTDMIIETDDIDLKNINRWNPNNYVNIWVVKEIARQGGNTSVVGYAYYPSSHGGDEDGLVCEAKYFGTTPAEDAIFIHELGHYFGLKHTFEGGCMNGNCLVDGDNVCDTPPDQSRHTDCNFNSCSTDVGGGSPFTTDVDDMTENFMDYSPFACYFAFTPGQADRMQASIEVERASLLASLGCVNPCPQPITATFSPASGTFSAGETVTFTNTSIGATDFTWYVNGVATATTTDFTFMFPDVGSYTITLEVGNANPDCIDVAAVKFETICPVVADLTASEVSIGVGESITFTSTSTNATTDEWYINNALVGTGSPFIYTFSTLGNYIVRLTSGNGFCEDNKIIFIKVTTPCTSSIDDTQFLYNVGENFYPYCITSPSDGGLLSYGQYITSSNTVGTIVKTAANGDLLWVNSYTGVNQMMKMAESTADNSYVLIANHETTKMPFLMKVNAATGAVIWKTDLTDLGFESFSYDLVILPNNDIFTIMGSRRVVRFSSAGAVQWSKELDGSGLTKFFSVTQRPDGALLIAGSIWEGATRESAVIFMDENGNVLDIKYYGVLGTNSILFNDIAVAADNSYTVHGSFRIPGGGFTDFHKLVFQCDASGNVLWAKDIDFPSGPTHSANKNYIVNTSDDGYILFGSTNAGTGTSRHFMKVDGNGNLLWTRAFDLPSATMRLVNLSGNNTPGCYIAMSGDDQLFITKIDGNGSAGGCNESDHLHPIVDIPLSYRSDPLPFLDIILNTASVIPSISTLSFPKISLCTQPSPCPEICDNGLDDDGDGYVDCFDSECDCGNDCMLSPPPSPISPHLAWETSDESSSSLCPPIVANMNPQSDTIPEIIVTKPDGTSIHGVNVYKSLEILFYKGDGSNKTAPSVLQFSASQAATSLPTVGDLDKDGTPELIVQCLDGRLRIYRNFDPNAAQAMQLWLTSQNTVPKALSRPTLADFDYDGIPEIYLGNNIYRLDLANQTLRKVLTGQGPTGNVLDYANTYNLTGSVAADLLSPADCSGDPDCNGLELVAGHVIYSIDPDPTDGDGLEIKIQRDLNIMDPSNTFLDGYTAIADVDLDGIGDILVSGRGLSQGHCLYIWNKNGLVEVFKYPLDPSAGAIGFAAGMPCVANVFDDVAAGALTDLPEIIMCSDNKLFCFNINAAILTPNLPQWWSIDTHDASYATGATVFDLNGDDIQEIIYKDEEDLRFLYGGAAPFPPGVDAERNWATIPLSSGTFDEYPVVADLDGNGTAEVVTTSNINGFSNLGKLQVFQDVADNWMPCRPIWNQFNYHATNINDDLTVPQILQKHWLEIPQGSGNYPLNSFLAQVPNLNSNTQTGIPAADAVATFDSVRCENGMLKVDFTICNYGNVDLPTALPIQFYLGNPSMAGATLYGMPFFTNHSIDVDSCLKMSVFLPSPSPNGQIYGIVNDNGSMPIPFDLGTDFPATSILECDYTNNIFYFEMLYTPQPLDLGADLFLCKNSVTVLDAGSGFDQYRWQDGSIESTFTAYEAGKYWVDVWDACGQKQTDTIEIFLDPALNFDLGADQTLCEGDSILLTSVTGAMVSWSTDLDGQICANCVSVSAKPNQSTLYYATAQQGACFFSDSVRIDVEQCADCVAMPLPKPISAELAWESPDEWSSAFGLKLVANMNPQTDAIPEIISLKYIGQTFAQYPNSYEMDTVLFYKGDGSDKANPSILRIPERTSTDVAVGDLDGDGKPELIAFCGDNYVRVYRNFDPSKNPAMELWMTSNDTITGLFLRPSLADINQDGTPEIYLGNTVLQVDVTAQTLTKAVQGQGPIGIISAGFPMDKRTASSAVDMLSPADCGGDPDCNGLEIVAGHVIYSIDLDPSDGDGLEMKIQRDLNNLVPSGTYIDGYTSVADIDLDGVADVIVTGRESFAQSVVYVWNKNGLLQTFKYPLSTVNGRSFPSIGNVFDDRKAGAAKDFPEVILSSKNQLIAFNKNAFDADPTKGYWWIAPSQENSLSTAPSLFDFNGDGLDEIVYRDELELHIYYGDAAPFPAGVDADRNWFRAPAISPTFDEYPTIADVDGDGIPEIVTTSSSVHQNINGQLQIYKDVDDAWMPCRPMWNQYNYHTAHVNDDASIPQFQQAHWAESPAGSGAYPANKFIGQITQGATPIPVADAVVIFDSVNCQNGMLQAAFTICNYGSEVLPDSTPIQFYLGNPITTAVPIYQMPFFTNQALDVDSCLEMSVLLPLPSPNGRIYGIVNDNGSIATPFDLVDNFPSTTILECDYTNNIFDFEMLNTPPPLNLGADITLCENSDTLLVAGSGFTQYLWQNGSTDSSFLANSVGKYWVDVWDACGQKQTDTIEIFLDAINAFDLGANQVLCPGDSLLLSAGTTVDWSSNLSGTLCTNCDSISIIPAQSTLYIATKQQGTCNFSDSIQIDVAPAVDFTLIATDGDCLGNAASISPTISGGTAPYTFLWSNAASDSTLMGIPAGTFSLTITDANGCTSEQTDSVATVGSLLISASKNDPKCHADSTGEIILTPSGGTAPFTYLWSDATTDSILQNAPSGTYNATITDANGCSAIESFTLSEPPAMSISASQNDPTCHADSTGEIILMPSGGTAPFSYLWSNATTDSILQNAPSGAFSATISDANGCSAIESFTLSEPLAISITSVAVQPKCDSAFSGQFSVSAMGGTAPFAYAWSNMSSDSALFNIASGMYTVTVTDAVGCTQIEQLTLSNTPTMGITPLQSEPKCFGDSTGTITLLVSSGILPFEFLWSDASTDSILTNVPAGNYAATVTDGVGCSQIETFTVTEPAEIALTTLITQPNCDSLNSGQISVSPSGGTTPFSYLWSLPNPDSVLQSIPAGMYTLTVVDAEGCSKNDTFNLQNAPPMSILTQNTAPNCFGDSTASMSVSVISGLAPYTYLWSDASTDSSLQNVPAGSYSVTITDANNCTQVEAFSIINPPQLSISTTTTEPLCDSLNSGQITLIPSGGTAPFDYIWSDMSSDSVLTNIPAGNYKATITDTNGCSLIESITLNSAPTMDISSLAIEPNCFGDTTGMISLSITNGLAPFSFVWSDMSTDSTLQDIGMGSYQATITDGNGCTQVESFDINEPSQISIATQITEPLCDSLNSGQIALSPSGGTAPFDFLWSDMSTDSVLSNIPAGDYTATVSDANGCSQIEVLTLTPPSVLDVFIEKTEPLCFGDSTGTIEVNASGGTPNYIYSFDNQILTPNNFIENVAAGIYFIQVEDAEGCRWDSMITMTQPDTFMVDLLISDTLILKDAGVTLTALPSPDSTLLASIEWSPAALFDATNELIELVYPSENTLFTVVLQDANGCEATAQQRVEILESEGIYFPNIIKPGSIDNGLFTVYGGTNVAEIEWLRVYTRWGELVFENENFAPNDPTQGWDGTILNKQAHASVYVFQTMVRYADGTTEVFTGDVAVVRE